MRRDASTITLFVPSLAGGGAERVALNLGEEFIRRKINVDLVLQRASGHLLDHVPNGVRVHVAGESTIGLVSWLGRYFRRRRPDAVFSFFNQVSTIPVLAKLISRAQAPVICGIHTTMSKAPSVANWPKTVKGRLRLRLFKFLLNNADGIIAVSHGVAHDLCDLTSISRSKVDVIYNPVIRDSLYQLAEMPIESDVMAQFSSFPVILGIGRLVPLKGFEVLLRALHMVREQVPAKLIILGEGKERPRLEATISDLGLTKHVWLPGFVHNPYNYIKAASVVAVSSRREGLPNVIVESLALGTPVVSTDCEHGPREILQNGRLGLLVPVDDPCRLAAAIIEALSDPMTIDRRALSKFSVTTAADQYLRTAGLAANV